MFATEVDAGASLPALLIQTVVVSICSLLLSLLMVWVPFLLDQSDSWIAGAIESVALIATGTGPAFLAAKWVARQWPDTVAAGKYVGLLPGVIVLLLVAATRGYLLIPHARGVEGMIWLAHVILVYPALGCIGYSAGMWSAGQRPLLICDARERS